MERVHESESARGHDGVATAHAKYGCNKEQGSSLFVYKFAKERNEEVCLAQTCLHKVAKRMKKLVDKK